MVMLKVDATKQQYAEDAGRHITSKNAVRMNGVFTVKQHILNGLKNVQFKSVRRQRVIEYKEEHRVGRRTAVKILEVGNDIAMRTLQAQQKSNFYKCTMNESHKRQ